MPEDTVICDKCQTSNLASATFCESCGHDLQNQNDKASNSLAFEKSIKHEERFLGIANLLIAIVMIVSVLDISITTDLFVFVAPPLYLAIILSLLIWLFVGGQLQRFFLILQQRKENLEMTKISD